MAEDKLIEGLDLKENSREMKSSLQELPEEEIPQQPGLEVAPMPNTTPLDSSTEP